MMNKSSVVLLIIVLFFISCKTNKSNKHQIAFYNVENLFDTIDTPEVIDEEFTPESEKRWNTEKYELKLNHISQVIKDMGKSVGLDAPTFIGLAEIENKQVLEELINNPNLHKVNYKIIHKDSPDKRGIDVAALYNPDEFNLIETSHRTLIIHDQETNERIFTRDLMIVKGTLDKDTVFILVNHWPSRYGGLERSIPSREAAAKLNRSVIDSILAINNNAKIITMGDLNDNPDDIAVLNTLNTVNKIEDIHNNELYNPMYNIYKSGKGTLNYRGKWNLFDQIILSKAMAKPSSQGIQLDSAFIFNKPYLIQQDGKYKGHLLRTFGGRKYLKGYSDHLPVYITIKNSQ